MDPFGNPTADPLPSTVRIHHDADARRVVEDARRVRTEIPLLELVDGDLCRSLSPAASSVDATDADPRVDVVSVLLDGRQHWYVAHLVARDPRWRGRVVAALNTPWVMGRAAQGVDPVDGQVDVFDGPLSAAERRRLRTRLATPTWPGPDERWRRAAAIDIELGRPTPVWLDGVEAGSAWYLSIRVEHRAAPYRREAAAS